MMKIAMHSGRGFGALATYFFLLAMSALADDAAIEAELDAYWKNVSSILAEGDFDNLVKTYHPDAVLVSESLGTSYPISQALKRWKPGILDTQAGKTTALVEFRIIERLFSATTSHEKGIFHYKSGPGENYKGDSEDAFTDAYIHFEAHLIKDGEWTSMMEYQKHPASQSEWDAK